MYLLYSSDPRSISWYSFAQGISAAAKVSEELGNQGLRPFGDEVLSLLTM